MPTLSVRTRITAAVAVLVLLALGGAGLIVAVLGRADAEVRARAAVEQELTEFVQFQQQNPSQGSPELINGFLLANVTTASELIIGYWDGAPQRWSASDRDGLALTPEFRELADELADSGGVARLQTGWGEVYVDAQPVSDGGALFVVYFLQDEYGELEDTLRTYAVSAFLALLVVTAAAAWVAGRLLRPIRTLRETAEEIGETDLSLRIPETGNDDITDLTRTVNAMLGRLDGAFAGQRAFLDDAGHELRTPLTILRGHLELLDSSDSTEVDHTRELVLDEVDRMSRLVDDLILLAKADRPDFVVPDRVDVAALLRTVVEKCRGLGELEWTLDAAPEVVVAMDEQRITQALLQLAANAVKHTDVDGVIGLGAQCGESGVRLWVRDNGPGVADEDKESIFRRFGRARVPEGDEGFGLGLSIVAAIAAGHGGSVAVYDEEPRGARFVIEVPLHQTKGSQSWPAS